MRDITKRRWPQFSMRQILLSTALFAAGLGQMLVLETPSYALWIVGCILIGLTFGLAVGVLLGSARRWAAIGLLGWLAFAVLAILN